MRDWSSTRPAHGWMLRSLIPWLMAGLMLVGFTISTGYTPGLPVVAVAATLPDELPPDPVPPIVSAPWRGMFLSTALPDDLDWMSEPDLAAAAPAEAPRLQHVKRLPAVIYDRRVPVLMTSFDGVAYAYEGYMPPVFLQSPQADGGTRGHDRAAQGPAGSGSSQARAPLGGGQSPTLLGAITARLPDGATPAVPRAAALASATPAPVEPEVIAMPHIPLPGTGESGFAGANPRFVSRPDYASLIDPDHMAREQRCLAEAIYFEARSEPEEGQAAVAQVVLNRVRSGLYPSNVCSVVYQNRNRYLGCQFSFACEGKSLRITEPGPWQVAVRIAREVTEGKTYVAGVGGATHYHANYVRPGWSYRLRKMERIGTHIFYSLRPGQV